MPIHAVELISVARLLIERAPGRRGRLPDARIRRSVSTSYYALFHLILDECGWLVVGTGKDLRRRRHLLARTITHSGMNTAFKKVSGAMADVTVREFLHPQGATGTDVPVPIFVTEFVKAFIDAQSKRHDADYDRNATFTETDADLLAKRAERAITAWMSANTRVDKEFKRGLCLLVLMKGQLRPQATG